MEPPSLVEKCSEIDDPRRARYAHRHDLVEVRVIVMRALCSDVECLEEMADWARSKAPWSRRFHTCVGPADHVWPGFSQKP